MVIDIFSRTNLKIDYQQKNISYVLHQYNIYSYKTKPEALPPLHWQMITANVTINISRETLDKESRFVHFQVFCWTIKKALFSYVFLTFGV